MTETAQTFEEALKAVAGDRILQFQTFDAPVLTVRREDLLGLVRDLHDREETALRFLTTICGMHYPAGTPVAGQPEHLGLVVFLHAMDRGHRVRIKCDIPMDDPSVDSLTPIFLGANWMEREAYDQFGILFRNHPNLKRILNVDHMSVFPLRKDFPLEDQLREDKNNAMFGR